MIAIIQPIMPHYRTSFFDELREKIEFDLYTFDKLGKKNDWDRLEDFNKNRLQTFNINKFVFYNPLPFLNSKYDVIVLSAQLSFITNWFLLFLNLFLNKKFILWGHGVDCSKNKPISLLRKIFYYLADAEIFYTENEKLTWDKIYPSKPKFVLNNTIKTSQKCNLDRNALRTKYNINQNYIFISSFRYTNPYRRVDILENIIKMSNKSNCAYIIIGDGPLKPNFGIYKNVYDFGEVFDPQIKCELFALADYYLQPAWVGLSIVEALSHGKPIITYTKSREVRQSVEYNYLINNYNSIILNNINENINNLILKIDKSKYDRMSINCKKYYEKNLNMENMVHKMYLALSYFTNISNN